MRRTWTIIGVDEVAASVVRVGRQAKRAGVHRRQPPLRRPAPQQTLAAAAPGEHQRGLDQDLAPVMNRHPRTQPRDRG